MKAAAPPAGAAPSPVTPAAPVPSLAEKQLAQAHNLAALKLLEPPVVRSSSHLLLGLGVTELKVGWIVPDAAARTRPTTGPGAGDHTKRPSLVILEESDSEKVTSGKGKKRLNKSAAEEQGWFRNVTHIVRAADTAVTAAGTLNLSMCTDCFRLVSVVER